MLSFNGNLMVHVALKPCDMRKSLNGLAAVARNTIGMDPGFGTAFLFTNQRPNIIKILCFDRTGYWVVAKHLERAPSAGCRTSRAGAKRSRPTPPRWPCLPMVSTYAAT